MLNSPNIMLRSWWQFLIYSVVFKWHWYCSSLNADNLSMGCWIVSSVLPPMSSLTFIIAECLCSFAAMRINGHGTRVPRHHGYESSSMISSDLESTSFFDSDDDASSRITATTTGNLTATQQSQNLHSDRSGEYKFIVEKHSIL